MEANETLALACAHHLVETQLKPDLLNDPEDTQHGGSDSLEQYYRALCSLDGARWQRAQALKDQLKKIQEVSDTYALKQRIDRLRSELTELRAGAASRAECGLAVQENIEWTATLLDKTQGIYRSRLEYLRVFGALKRQERLLKQKEEVSSGLNLIEYEQLKIENQTLSQKLEQREKELLVANTRSSIAH